MGHQTAPLTSRPCKRTPPLAGRTPCPQLVPHAQTAIIRSRRAHDQRKLRKLQTAASERRKPWTSPPLRRLLPGLLSRLPVLPNLLTIRGLQSHSSSPGIHLFRRWPKILKALKEHCRRHCGFLKSKPRDKSRVAHR